MQGSMPHARGHHLSIEKLHRLEQALRARPAWNWKDPNISPSRPAGWALRCAHPNDLT